MKENRLEKILQIINEQVVLTQDDLQAALEREGYLVQRIPLFSELGVPIGKHGIVIPEMPSFSSVSPAAPAPVMSPPYQPYGQQPAAPVMTSPSYQQYGQQLAAPVMSPQYQYPGGMRY